MKREIRSSSIAGISGVGAVVDVGKESFLIPGIEKWSQRFLRRIDLPRLSLRLGKQLKAPVEQKGELLTHRFPRAMFCEKCRRIVQWKTALEVKDKEPHCPEPGCEGNLVAMRFVLACENGHLEDVPWHLWAHSGTGGNHDCKSYDKLTFGVDASLGSGGLGSLVVKCKTCGSSRSLEEISSKNATRQVFPKCRGHHPWIHDSEPCDAIPLVLQRGATNLHFPKTVSALDIPEGEHSNPIGDFADQVRASPRYRRLLDFLGSSQGASQEMIEILAEHIASMVACTVSTVLAIAEAELAGRPIESPAGVRQAFDQKVILDEEWATITRAIESGELITSNFVAVATELELGAPEWLKRLVNGVLLIRKLREVRAYQGFWRVKPGAEDKLVIPDIGQSQEWVPATEVFGEGIVVALDFEELSDWDDSLPFGIVSEVAALEQRRKDSDYWFLPEIDPAFLALHTLSHLLMRRLTFECGYSASSLKERLYFNNELKYAGIMIFTADGDSEGSLGGLVRQGAPDRLARTLLEATEEGSWCSADPVCTETAGQGLGGFNHAACHACSLVSETSCTCANTLLDRRMLYDADWGLLSYLEWQK